MASLSGFTAKPMGLFFFRRCRAQNGVKNRMKNILTGMPGLAIKLLLYFSGSRLERVVKKRELKITEEQMKIKAKHTKLTLNKTTITALDHLEMNNIQGKCGVPTDDCRTDEKTCLYDGLVALKESRTCYETMDTET